MTATAAPAKVRIPEAEPEATVRVGGRTVRLTNLTKVFWPGLGLTKRDLLQYYADVAPVLLPYLRDRAMVMKRYPDGIRGKWFFMKRAPSPRPEWIETCEIMHKSRNLIPFPMVQDVASLLWVVNLGCIDLNPWYACCDDVNRPDHLPFDLDPGEGTAFDAVRPTAEAGVSTPVTWEEVERGFEPTDFTLRTVPARIRAIGDLWKVLRAARGRFRLGAGQ